MNKFKAGDWVKRIVHSPHLGVNAGDVFQVTAYYLSNDTMKLRGEKEQLFFSCAFVEARPTLTDWFPIEQNPWEPGVYEVKCDLPHNKPNWYSYWDGVTWNGGWNTAERAFKYSNNREGLLCPRSWRGVKYI